MERPYARGAVALDKSKNLSAQLRKLLHSGQRLARPAAMPNAVWELVCVNARNCWNELPEDRISFQQMRRALEGIAADLDYALA